MELPKRDLLVSKTWIQAVALVVVFGFFVLGLLAYRIYSGEAPIPARVVDQKGIALFTGDDVTGGQQIFLRNGLMEYGSIFGHGAYLGPDYTADYLRRSATSVYEVTAAKNRKCERSDGGGILSARRVNGPFPHSPLGQPATVSRIAANSRGERVHGGRLQVN